jgi:hypothetical protein
VLTIEGEDGGADVKFEVRLESLMSQRAPASTTIVSLWHSRTNDLTKFERFRRSLRLRPISALERGKGDQS